MIRGVATWTFRCDADGCTAEETRAESIQEGVTSGLISTMPRYFNAAVVPTLPEGWAEAFTPDGSRRLVCPVHKKALIDSVRSVLE